MPGKRDYPVTLRVVRECSATIRVPARDQAEVDRLALALYDDWAGDLDIDIRIDLGFPPPWEEHEPIVGEPEIDRTFRCVDCNKDVRDGEYYAVTDELWAASGLAPFGDMLCLADLERRIGRWLRFDDFTALVTRDWQRHVAARRGDVGSRCPSSTGGDGKSFRR